MISLETTTCCGKWATKCEPMISLTVIKSPSIPSNVKCFCSTIQHSSFLYLPLKGHHWNTTDMAYASVASLLNTIQLLLTPNSQMHSQICDRREEFYAFVKKDNRKIGEVAKDVKSFVTKDPDEQCLHVLGLSYNHLTSDLKACLCIWNFFLKHSEVSVKRLVRLWIAEGFLKFEKDLEGVAEKCLQDLIDRCLVLVSNKS
ncbi:hypothetical protein HAX54_006426 [Datura stramonium]|uniref:Disease resistance protein winged helix domain-containing protein n=1 Tax=Datura stramonium TaxID=4076 RepID=A0ABS8TBK4_DATST|nr:hypothetical protein [Datura stramonium]